jgi:pyruvate kinase
MYENGVNIVRFNFSHATHDHSKVIAERIKKLNAEKKTNLSLLLDTKGPEIRTGIVEEKISLLAGNTVKIVVDETKRGKDDIFCDYEYLLEDVKV